MNVRYRVALSQAEREQLSEMLRGGHHAARQLKRAQILLAADSGATDTAIATSVAVGESTVYRTKRRFVLNNLEQALSEEPRPAPPRKLSGKEEALLIATACANPPQGRARWTLELLADEMVRLTDHSELSRETVRRRLAENELKPWRQDMWCIPEVDGTFVARMEDVLDLYAETPEAAGGLLRREPCAADRRNTPTDPGSTGTAAALRLCISPQRHGKPVRLSRRAAAVAQGKGHRPAHGTGFCRVHA
jgi:transposase